MTVDELVSKGFAASELLDAGVSCDDVERQYGEQKAQCGNNTWLIVAIVVVVVLFGAAVSSFVWCRQKKSANALVGKGCPPRSTTSQLKAVLANPTISGNINFNNADSTNVEYNFATTALSSSSTGSIIYTANSIYNDEKRQGADARRPSYSTAIDDSEGPSLPSSLSNCHTTVSRSTHKTRSSSELDKSHMPPAGRGIRSQLTSAKSGGQCQRPSPRGGACKKSVLSDSSFCKGHTCTITGCTAAKSAKVHTCPEHSTVAYKRKRAFAVTMQLDGKLWLKKDGDEVYVVPSVSCSGGHTMPTVPQVGDHSLVDDAATSTFATDNSPAVVPRRQRLRSALNSSSHASEYSLVPLAPAVLVPSSTGTLYAVPSEYDAVPPEYASPLDTDHDADEWAANAANAIEYGSAVDGTDGTANSSPVGAAAYADEWAAGVAKTIEYGSAVEYDDAYAESKDSKLEFVESTDAMIRLPTARREERKGIPRNSRQGSSFDGFGGSSGASTETFVETARHNRSHTRQHDEGVVTIGARPKQARIGISRGGGGRQGSVYTGFGERLAEKELSADDESEL
jgi:hypothetical protein